MHSPTALIFPARDTGNLTVRPNSTVSEVLMDARTNRASGVRVIDSQTKEVLDFTARVVVLAASTLESTRLLLLSKSPSRPERPRELVRRRRPLLLRARHGAWRERHDADAARQGRHERRRAPAEHLHRAVPQPRGQASRTSFGATDFRAGAAASSTRRTPTPRLASARRSSRRSAPTIRRRSTSRRSAKCWLAARTRSSSTRR